MVEIRERFQTLEDRLSELPEEQQSELLDSFELLLDIEIVLRSEEVNLDEIEEMLNELNSSDDPEE